MFEKFLSRGSRDFRQRYEGTYGFFRDDNGKKMLSQLTRITERECVFMDIRGVEYRLNADAEGEKGFEFIPPKSGYFNTAHGAVYIQRHAARQFQRGVSSNNTLAYLLTKGTLLARRISFSLMADVYEKALAPKEALPHFLSRKVDSWSPSSMFGFEWGGSLYVLGEPIGKWSLETDTFKINLEDKTLFRTEIADALKAVEQKVEFV